MAHQPAADHGPMTAKQRARIMALCNRAGLGQDERHEVAEYLLGLEGGSLGRATHRQAERLVDFVDGYVTIHQLLALRPPGCEPGAPRPTGSPVYATDDCGRRWVVAYR